MSQYVNLMVEMPVEANADVAFLFACLVCLIISPIHYSLVSSFLSSEI